MVMTMKKDCYNRSRDHSTLEGWLPMGGL